MTARRLRTRLIINPISGTRTKQGLADAIAARVKAMGHDIDVCPTTGPGDATRLATEAADQGFDVVLACGGDGTVNEVARGLIGTRTALAILPNGSGNGLGRHIDIPAGPIQALRVFSHGRVVECDYCSANDRPFFCTFGVGFDAAVSRRFASHHRRGLTSYIKSAVDEFLKFKHEDCRLTVNGVTRNVDAFLIACCNASQYGNNAYIAPTASITDGQLDITLIHSGHPISELFVGVELLAGLIAKGGLVDTFRTDSVIIERNAPGPVHIDGESTDMPARIEIACHRGGIRIYAPVHRMRFIPILTPAIMTVRDWGVTLARLFSK